MYGYDPHNRTYFFFLFSIIFSPSIKADVEVSKKIPYNNEEIRLDRTSICLFSLTVYFNCRHFFYFLRAFGALHRTADASCSRDSISTSQTGTHRRPIVYLPCLLLPATFCYTYPPSRLLTPALNCMSGSFFFH